MSGSDSSAAANHPIGWLSAQSGFGVDAIRFYERIGLLPTARRTAAGYRVYGGADVERLGFVRRAQNFGFSLEEIARLLEGRSEEEGVAAARDIAREKLALVEAKAAELARLRADLQELVERCPGAGEAADCPIYGALEQRK